MEEWRDIEGYEGKYQVSNTGKVKSLNYLNTGKERELKQKLNKYGYYEVSLSKHNHKRGFLISTLVAKAFIPNPNCKPKVMHISSDVTDNRVENLRWAYISEIKFAMYKNGKRKGEPSDNIISYKGKPYKSFYEMAKDFNVIKNNVFFKRIDRGWDLESALEVKTENTKNKKTPRKIYEYYGEYLSIRQLAIKININEKTLRKRLNAGWSTYECEIPTRKTKRSIK